MSETPFESYYQFCPKIGYPVLIKFENAGLESSFTEILREMNFDLVESSKALDTLSVKNSRVLILKESTLSVTRQILDFSVIMRSYGSEVVTRKNNYNIYVQDSSSMMVFDEDYTEWSAGIIDSESNDYNRRLLLGRYLSYSLLDHGVFGFWGMGVDEGFVSMKPKSSKGKCVFIDLKKSKIVCSDGVKPIKSTFKVFRLEATLRNESKNLSSEELASFLMTNNTYLASGGLDPALKKLIFALCSKAQGVVYPENLFKVRENSSAL